MDYPNGDVPKNKGVCTDVLIRAYRKLGIDLQKEVYLDMKANFDLYPDHWGLKTTDKNIDHRRVPNLMTFFERQGEVRPITDLATDYTPGDIVCWNLGGGVTHIGIVANKKSRDGKRPLIIHNIGAGQVAQGEKDIYLFGTSMGSVAILKAINDYDISPKSIIIECPFGSMYETVSSRFSMMNLPSFPMAGLLVFWGGIQNGFWAFDHNPRDYAKNVDCPVLLMYGEQDQKVSKQEIEDIYSGLAGKKRLITYPKAGHENYLTKYKRQWSSDIRNFLLNH